MFKLINRFLGKITIILVVIGMLWFSRGVLSTALNNSNQMFYEVVPDSQLSDEHSEERNREKNVCSTIVIQKPVIKILLKNYYSTNSNSKKIFLYHILCMVFIIVLGITLAVLLVMLLKDDSCVRFEKLDELARIRENLIEGISYKEVLLEENTMENSSKSKTSKKNIKSSKSIKAELVKHYMSCIADI